MQMPGSPLVETALPKPAVLHLISVVVAATSPLLPLAQQLCVKLNLHAELHAVLVLGDDAGGRQWFKERVGLLTEVALFIPFVDEPWLLAEENLLEFTTALRQSILSDGKPLLLPVISSTVDDALAAIEAFEQEHPEEAVDIPSPSLQRAVQLVPVIKSASFFLRSDVSAAEMAVRVVNFLQQLDFHLALEAAAAPGRGIVPVFEAAMGGRKPNSGVVRALEEQVTRPGPERCTELAIPRVYCADVGCVAIAQCLKALPALRRLDLSGNGVNNKGITALCEALRYHPSITAVSLSNNIFSITGAAELLMLVRKNRRITELDISDNLIGSEVWEGRIRREVDANRLHGHALDLAPAHSSVTPRPSIVGLPAQDQRTPRDLRDDNSVAGASGSMKPAPSWPAALSCASLLCDEGSDDVVATAGREATLWSVQVEHHGSGVIQLQVKIVTRDGTQELTAGQQQGTPQPGVDGWGAIPHGDVLELSTTLAQPETLATADPERRLHTAVVAYLDAFVPSHFLSFHRVNGKTLKFVLESPTEGVEHIAALVREWLLARRALPNAEAVCRGEQTVSVKLIESDPGAADGAFFVAATVAWYGPQRVGKSLVQLYRAHNITQYSGNMADEVAALVDIAAQEGSDEKGAAADPDADVAEAQRRNDEALLLQNRQISMGVVDAWGGRPPSQASQRSLP